MIQFYKDMGNIVFYKICFSTGEQTLGKDGVLCFENDKKQVHLTAERSSSNKTPIVIDSIITEFKVHKMPTNDKFTWVSIYHTENDEVHELKFKVNTNSVVNAMSILDTSVTVDNGVFRGEFKVCKAEKSPNISIVPVNVFNSNNIDNVVKLRMFDAVPNCVYLVNNNKLLFLGSDGDHYFFTAFYKNRNDEIHKISDLFTTHMRYPASTKKVTLLGNTGNMVSFTDDDFTGVKFDKSSPLYCYSSNKTIILMEENVIPEDEFEEFRNINFVMDVLDNLYLLESPIEKVDVCVQVGINMKDLPDDSLIFFIDSELKNNTVLT